MLMRRSIDDLMDRELALKGAAVIGRLSEGDRTAVMEIVRVAHNDRLWRLMWPAFFYVIQDPERLATKTPEA